MRRSLALLMVPFLLASEGLAGGGGTPAPDSPPSAPPAPPAPPPAPATIVVPKPRVTRQSVKEEPVETPKFVLLNSSKRTACFAHSAFHATLTAGASVPIPDALVDTVESELQRLTDEGRNKDAENPIFFEVIKL